MNTLYVFDPSHPFSMFVKLKRSVSGYDLLDEMAKLNGTGGYLIEKRGRSDRPRFYVHHESGHRIEGLTYRWIVCQGPGDVETKRRLLQPLIDMAARVSGGEASPIAP